MKFQASLQHNISYPTFHKSRLLIAGLALLAPLASIFLVWQAYLGSPGLRFVYAYGDPDYGYLFNSLLLLDGKSPWHIDHPGTPVQMIGALVMPAWHWLTGTEPTLVADFFRHSLGYHRAVILTGFAAFLLSQWFCGWRLLRAGLSPPAVLLAQATPFFLFETAFYFRHTSPETWIAALSLLLVPMVWEGRALAAGVLTGVILTLKIYSAPLVLLLLALPRPRDWLLAGAAAAFMLLNITSLWWEHLPRWSNWITLLSTRQGNYGTGPEGQPGLATLWENLLRLSKPELGALVAVLALALPFLAWARFTRRERQPGPRFGPELLAGFFLVLMAVRHTPVPRYLIPLVAPLGLLLARTSLLPALPRSSIPVLGLLALPLTLGGSLESLRESRVAIERHNEAVEAELARFPACAYLFPDAMPIEAFALFSGHLATNGEYEKELRALYPRHFFPAHDGVYRTYTHREWTRDMLDEALAPWPCRLYLYDNPLEANLPAPSPLHLLPKASRPPWRIHGQFTVVHYVETPLTRRR